MIDMYVRDDKGEKVKTSEDSGHQQKILDNSTSLKTLGTKVKIFCSI